MTIKSYPLDKIPSFEEGKKAPVHLGNIDGRCYFAFPYRVKAPKGGRTAKESDVKRLRDHSPTIRHIKEKAQRRIKKIAPLWKQQNALYDVVMLERKDDLSDAEKTKLKDAHALLAEVYKLREDSNKAEENHLSGKQIDTESYA